MACWCQYLVQATMHSVLISLSCKEFCCSVIHTVSNLTLPSVYHLLLKHLHTQLKSIPLYIALSLCRHQFDWIVFQWTSTVLSSPQKISQEIFVGCCNEMFYRREAFLYTIQEFQSILYMSAPILTTICSFLPRDAMCKRGLCCVRCPSVRLSRWCIVSTRLKLYRQTSLSARQPIIPVFWTPAPVPNSKVNLHRRRKIQGDGGNFAILSRKRYEIGPWLLWNVNRKSYALYRMVAFSITLTDP